MSSVNPLFPASHEWDVEDSRLYHLRESMKKERAKDPFALQAWSDDPALVRASMARLKAFILKAIPPGTVYLEALMKIASYEWSKDIESAGVTCETLPVFLFNPQFLDRHCIFLSDLRMLILHELHHVLYGHHVLCGENDIARNVAFDAVVNARLCRVWQEPAHAVFFRDIYKSGGFPEMLLCPPPGWPGAPDRLMQRQERLQLLRDVDMKTAVRAVDVRNRLYAPDSEVGFEEVLELVLRHTLMAAPRLLGNHGGSGFLQTARNKVAHSFVSDTARKVHALLGEAERSRNPKGTCGSGRDLFNVEISALNPRSAFLMELRRVLLKAGVYRQQLSSRRRRKKATAEREMVSVLPNWTDRTAFARIALQGMPPVLYHGMAPAQRHTWKPVGEAHVYLDVSGSMAEELPWIIGALRPLEKNGLCRIFLFSTVVTALPRRCLDTGKVPTTGGTDIQPVMEHLVGYPAAKRPRHAVVLTDGIFRLPAPHSSLRQAFEKAGVALHGAITPRGRKSPLENIAASITQLPQYK